MTRCAMAMLVALACTAAQAQPGPGLITDVHAHFQPSPGGRTFPGALRAALAFMDEHGIQRMVLMPPPFGAAAPLGAYDIEDLQFARQAGGGRIAVLGGSSLNRMLHATPPAAVDDGVRTRFRARAEEILAMGAAGFGEIAALHVSIPAMGPRHPYEEVAPDHPLLLLLADIAAERGVPIDLHCDLVPQDMPLPEPLSRNAANPSMLRSNLPGLRRLLAHNPAARIVWSHVGFEPLLTRDPATVRELLSAHPNLSMSFRLNRGAPRPGAALDPTGNLKPGWRALIEAYADRFLLGSDRFHAPEGVARGSGAEQVEQLKALLAQLSPETAAKVAGTNAERLYRFDR